MKKQPAKDAFSLQQWEHGLNWRDFFKVAAATGMATLGTGALVGTTSAALAASAVTAKVNAFDILQAASYAAKSGTVLAEADSEGGQDLGSISNGDWVSYAAVDFGGGADHITARVASARHNLPSTETHFPLNSQNYWPSLRVSFPQIIHSAQCGQYQLMWNCPQSGCLAQVVTVLSLQLHWALASPSPII